MDKRITRKDGTRHVRGAIPAELHAAVRAIGMRHGETVSESLVRVLKAGIEAISAGRRPGLACPVMTTREKGR